jgi:hypothetical protein
MRQQPRSLVQQFAGRYWLILGALGFLAASLSSIVRSIEPTSLGDNLYMAVDWLAACIIYFFLAALIGFAIDRFLTRKQKKPVAVPLWFWLTVIVWVGGSLLVAIMAPGELSPVVLVVFPLAYGIFFPGIAFNMLFPAFVQKTLYGKLVLDILYLGVFGFWIYLETRERSVLARRVLLIVLFAVLLLGVVGCSQALALNGIK